MSEASTQTTIVVARYLTLWQHELKKDSPYLPLSIAGQCRTKLPAPRCSCGQFHIVVQEEAREET